MKKLLFILFILLGTSQFALSQAPGIHWQKSLGGSSPDEGIYAIQTRDGGYVVSGDVKSNDGNVSGNHGDFDYWIVKLDTAGNILWQKALGGSGADRYPSLVQAKDGGYVVAGVSTSVDGDVTNPKGDFDYWVVKLDSLGNKVWQKSYGGTGSDFPHSIINTADGGYAVVGGSYSTDGDVTGNHGSNDYWVVKIDSGGALQWQKSYGGTQLDYGFSIVQTPDKGYGVAGFSSSNDGNVTGNHGGVDYWVIRIDSVGKLLWQKSLGTAGGDNGYSIDMTTDHGFVVGGSSDGAADGHGQADYWVVKLDSTGNILWSKSLGGSGLEQGLMIKATTDGGCVMQGYTGSTDGQITGTNHGSFDFWVVKLDCGGDLVWQRLLGGSGYDPASAIIQTRDEGYLVTGATSSNDFDASGNHGGVDYWVVKLDCATPVQPDAIVGDSLVCGSSNITYQVPCIGNASTYNWTLPVGATIVSGSNTRAVVVNFPANFSGGQILVNGVSKCGSGPASLLNIKLSNPLVAGAIAGDTLVCENTNAPYSIPLITGASGYNWVLPAGGTIVSGANTAAIVAEFSTSFSHKDITVNAIGGCTANPQSTLLISALSPPVGGTVSATKDTLCEGAGDKTVLTATGTVGNITWQSSTDGIHFTAISGANDTSYNTPPVFQTTYYRTQVLNSACSPDSSSAFIIYVIPGPAATFTYTANGSQVTFNSSGTIGATSFSWDFDDGGTSTDANPTHLFATHKVFNVCLTAYNETNCSYTKCIAVDLSTGVKNISHVIEFSFYPNPVGDQLTISNNGIMNSEIAIQNMLGQSIITQAISGTSGKTVINVSQLPAGVYFIRLTGKDGFAGGEKFVKE